MGFKLKSELANMNLVDLFKKFDVISYHPSMNMVTGGVTATILLQQIVFRFINAKFKPFYKFKQPCTARLYNKGDSWTEELGFTPAEFNSAIKKLRERNFITTKVDAQRLTWYNVNVDTIIDVFVALLGKIPQKIGKKPKAKDAVKPELNRARSAVAAFKDVKVVAASKDSKDAQDESEGFSYRLPIESRSDKDLTEPPSDLNNDTTLNKVKVVPKVYNVGELSELSIRVFKWLKDFGGEVSYGFENPFQVVKYFQANGFDSPLYHSYANSA